MSCKMGAECSLLLSKYYQIIVETNIFIYKKKINNHNQLITSALLFGKDAIQTNHVIYSENK